MNPYRNWFRFFLLFILIALLTLSSIPSLHSFAQEPASPHHPLSKSGQAWKKPVTIDVIQNKSGAYVKAHPPANIRTKQPHVADEPRGKTPNSRYIGQESIIGKDDRTQVENTTQYPYSAIAHIESDIGGCTGWLVDDDLLITAGHCVYDPQSQEWASWATIYPGRHGNQLPYGSAKAIEFYTVSGWANDGNPDYDYGAIRIDRPLGQATGWFGFRWQKASLDGTEENISGYPGDKEYGTQWEHRDQIRKSTLHKLHYANDTFSGQSGSPVYIENDSHCGPCSIAVHTNGVYGDSIYNRGTRINEQVFNNFLLWIAQ